MRALAMLAALACCGEPATGRTATVEAGAVSERVLLTGALHPVNAAVVFVPTTEQGSLGIRWLVDDGTVVKAGDRVAELDSSPFSASLTDMHSQLRGWESQYTLQQRANDLTLASKRFELRRAEIERDKAALRAGIPAELQLGRAAQESQLSLQRADMRLATTRKEVAAATEQSALDAKIQLIVRDKVRRSIAYAEESISQLVVRAPRDGVVVVATTDARKLRVGEQVRAGAPLVSMPDLDTPMEVVAELSDVDDGRIEPHQTGACTLDAYPGDPIVCTVKTIAAIAHTTRGKDSLRRTFEVTLSLAHVDPARLRPGMAFEVELHRPPVHALVVPRAAVFAGHHVILASGEVRVVELGPCDAQRCAVTRGLDAGDVVSLGGAS